MKRGSFFYQEPLPSVLLALNDHWGWQRGVELKLVGLRKCFGLTSFASVDTKVDFNRKAVNLMSSFFNLWQWSEKPHCNCFYIYDIHLQVAWWGAIFVGFCHRVMVDLADAGGAALLLVVVGLDDGPKPTFPHHNHKWQITRESHACDSPPSFPLRQLIDPSCKRAHCTSYIAPIIARTLFVQSFGK